MDITVKTKDEKNVFNYSVNSIGSWIDFDHKKATDENAGPLGGLELEIIPNGDVYGILRTGGKEITKGYIYDKDDNTIPDNCAIEDGDVYFFVPDEEL